MSANIPIEKKKQEAIARMKKLGLYHQIIQMFEDNNVVSRSEAPFGGYYWVSDEELEAIRCFEALYDALVYTVIRTHFMDGTTMDSYLYVSDHEEEWGDDREDIEYKMPYVYVVNYRDPDFSEFGRIRVKLGVAAGLLRIE